MTIHEQRTKLEADLKRAKDRQKQIEKKLKQCDRNYRIHQLCVRGGVVNRLLRYPDDLDDQQVEVLLNLAFEQPDVQDMLKAMLPDLPLNDDEGESVPID